MLVEILHLSKYGLFKDGMLEICNIVLGKLGWNYLLHFGEVNIRVGDIPSFFGRGKDGRLDVNQARFDLVFRISSPPKKQLCG